MKTIITVTGPSCAGKSTLEKKLRSLGVANMVSHTTREPRAGEVDGENYYFTDEVNFQRMLLAGEFIEFVRFNDFSYGMSKRETFRQLENHDAIVVVVDPEGAMQMRKFCRENGIYPLMVFVDAQDDVMAHRFLERFVGDMLTTYMRDKQKAFEVYSARLGTMFGTEQTWRRQAREMKLPYQVYFSKYDESNADTAANMILSRVREEIATPPSTTSKGEQHAA